jgi:hypothetical protein
MIRSRLACMAWILAAGVASGGRSESVVSRPYEGVTVVRETVVNARQAPVTLHVAQIDLTAPGISFSVTEHAGTRETRRQTTVDFVRQEGAVLGINTAFFNPVVPAERVAREPEVFLAGMVVSRGQLVSAFDPQPADELGTLQSYAIVPYAPALNIDVDNRVSVVHHDPAVADRTKTREKVALWNAVSGSAQIITDGRVTIPTYRDEAHPDGQLTPRPGNPPYDNRHSWYDVSNARTAIGYTRDGRTLVLLVAQRAGENGGLTVAEVARVLRDDYGCYQALNLDGGGSTAMALRDPATGEVRLLNVSSDAAAPGGRAQGANLAVFARVRGESGVWVLWALAAGALVVAMAGRDKAKR